MSFRLDSKNFLDPKTCYEMWAKQRISIYNSAKILAGRGVVNPKTGKPPTPQGVWRAASLYILEHPETAKADTVSLFSQHGQVWDEQAERDFALELISKARQFLSRTKYKQFIQKNPGLKQYEQS